MKLGINHRKRNEKKTDDMETKQHDTKNPKGQWGNQKEILKYPETNNNENTTIQNLWDAAKAGLRGKFIVIQAFLKKTEKSQINNLKYNLKQLGKEEETKT